MIVIVAPADDPHAQAVVDALVRRGRADLFRLDLEKAFENLSLQWKADAAGMEWTITSRSDASTLNPRDITSVYWRRPVRELTSPYLTLPTSALLDSYEIFWSMRWLLETLPAHLFPLGHPYVLGRAENKHRQMQAALQCGLRIPASFHSNDPAALERFVATQGEIALKALRLPGVIQDGTKSETRHIFCKSFGPDFLLNKLRGVARTQLFCQEAVIRARDFRIMVFPHEIIAAEIDITRLAGNKLDWREDCLDLPHRIVSLPREFAQQLRNFLRLMELQAGYFDFAAPDDGPPVFFECNTNAQWLWIEQLTGNHSISEAIARELADVPGPESITCPCSSDTC